MPNKILKLSISLILVISACCIFSYDNFTTHPLLSESAAAVYGKQAGAKLTDQQKQWIIKGSINEDIDPRYLNHFYDPTTGKGLDGWDVYKKFNIKVNGKSAKQWAKNQDSATGDYSESAILKNYQDGDLSRAYQGIGHILHLIQDMAVPAHTRNDPHSAGDPYEKWAEQHGAIDSSRLNFIAVDNLDQAFDKMANYSHDNFFSRDTVNVNNIKNYKTAIELVDGKNRMYLLNTTDNYLYKFAYSKNPEWIMPVFQVDDDPSLHQDYWNMLYPKAVGYSAGAIDYFVKQFAKIDQAKKEQEQISLFDKLKNSLVGLTNEAKYVWGDVYMAQNKVLASGYDNIVKLAGKTKNSLQFSYSYAKPTTAPAPLQITVQDKPAGRVLAASEQAGQGEKFQIPPTPFNKGGENAKPVQTVNVPAVKQTAIAKTVNPKIPPAPFDKGGEIKPEPKIPPAPFAKGGEIKPEPKIPPAPFAKGGEIKPEPKIPPAPFAKGGEIKPEPQIPPTPFDKGGEAPAMHRKGSDSLPPETSILSAPNAVSSSTSASFVFSSNEADSSFECDLDNAGWQECLPAQAGGVTNLSNLSEGSHNLKVRARDLLNNIDQTPAEYNWIVDTVAPIVSITSYPQSISTSTTANFQIDSNENEASFICQLDMNPWQECSATTSAADLIDGWHIMEAKGIDIAGNTSSSTAITWIIDTAAPASSVSALLAEYPSTGFSVSWSGTDGQASTTSGLADFDIQYKIGSGQWQNWIMATTTTNAVFDIIVNNGSSVYFRSRASDSAGNLENWPDNENGDASAAIASLPPAQPPIVLSDVSSALSNWKSSFSWKHTVNGNDPVLVVSLHGDGDYLNDDAVTYDGQTLSLAVKKIHGAYDNKAVFMYYLANPTQGEHDITAKVWGLPFAASAATFLNCDISDPVGLADSFFKSQYDYVRTIPMPDYVTMSNYATTTINGMMLIDAVTYGRFDDISAASPGEGQTQYFEQKSTPPGGAWFGQTIYDYLYAGQSYKLVESAGLHSMDWITDDPQSAVHVIIGLNPKP